MTVEKKIVAWETMMTILLALMVFSPLIDFFLINFSIFESFPFEILMFLSFMSLTLFLLIYFIFPQPFQALLSKAKEELPKRDSIFFHHDLLKVKVSTEFVSTLYPNYMAIYQLRDMKLQYRLQVSMMELSEEDQDALLEEKKKKTRYARWVTFLNVGSLTTFGLFMVAGRSQIPFLVNGSFLFFGLLIFFLYLRYSYNMYILLQFNKKLNQIQETSTLTYLDIRDLYEGV